jgi:hypothetical protein
MRAPRKCSCKSLVRLPRASVRIHIPQRGIILTYTNVDEGPFSQRQRWKIRKENLHCEGLEASAETISPYTSAQTICYMCDHGRVKVGPG